MNTCDQCGMCRDTGCMCLPITMIEPSAQPVQPDLKTLVRKVHKAKGRYHSQIAICDLYDACGLPNVRPGAEVAQPVQPAPQRQPLTNEEVETIGDKVANMPLVGVVSNFRTRFTRAIEAAHGIGDKT